VRIPKVRKPGGRETAKAQGLALDRGAGCSSAVQHPSRNPCGIVACGQSADNLCLGTPLVVGNVAAGMDVFQVAVGLLKNPLFQAQQFVGGVIHSIADCSRTVV
jgi:hypothetical protein